MRRESAPAIVRHMRRLRLQPSSASFGPGALALAALTLAIPPAASDQQRPERAAPAHPGLSSLPPATRGPISAALGRAARAHRGGLLELSEANGGEGDQFGFGVAISGNTIVAGAEGRSGHRGVIYVFTEPSAGWAGRLTQTAELTASDGQQHERFGTAVAISGGTIVAGADSHEVGANGGQGTLYVFERPAGGWTNATQNAELTATDGRTHDNLGYAVALAGNTVVASAPLHAVGGNPEQGVVYVFTKPRSGWRNAKQTAVLSASHGRARDHFGWGVALAGATIAVGAPRHTVGATKSRGRSTCSRCRTPAGAAPPRAPS